MTALRATFVACAALLLLSGCTPPDPDVTPSPTAVAVAPSPTASASPTPTPAPIAMPDLSGTELVLVTTTATAPNGAVLDLTMTTYYPVTVASPEGRAILAYLRANGDATDVSNDAFLTSHEAILQLSTITASDAAPGTMWPSDVGATPHLGPGILDTLVGLPLSHNVQGWPLITGAGTGYGVAALYGTDGAPAIGLDDWASFWTFYGFENRDFAFDVSNCEIVTTALAQERPEVFTWADVPYNCEVGIGH